MASNCSCCAMFLSLLVITGNLSPLINYLHHAAVTCLRHSYGEY